MMTNWKPRVFSIRRPYRGAQGPDSVSGTRLPRGACPDLCIQFPFDFGTSAFLLYYFTTTQAFARKLERLSTFQPSPPVLKMRGTKLSVNLEVPSARRLANDIPLDKEYFESQKDVLWDLTDDGTRIWKQPYAPWLRIYHSWRNIIMIYMLFAMIIPLSLSRLVMMKQLGCPTTYVACGKNVATSPS